MKAMASISFGFSLILMALMSFSLARRPDIIKKKEVQNAGSSTPQFMVDIYNYYSKSGKKPVADIIRCFSGTGLDQNTNEFPEDSLEISYKFTFNLTGLHRRERVRLADLRVFTKLFDNSTSLEIELFHYVKGGRQELIASRTLHGVYSNWVVFNLKSRFRKWLRQNYGDLYNYQVHLKLRSSTLQKVRIGGLKSSEKTPLLVVFSKEQRKTKTKQLQTPMPESPMALFAAGRSKRHLKASKRRQRLCSLKPMYIDFKSIGWDSWVIAPQGYQAYKCSGKCTIPIKAKHDPTNHAVVQTLAHDTGVNTRAACCVPNKLSAISMLYRDDNNVLTFRYKYEGMVVESCACR